MKIVFVDQLGAVGRVREDLSVDYEGLWRDEIETYVEALEAEVDPEGRRPDLDAVDQDLLLDLPERVPVTEIERRDG